MTAPEPVARVGVEAADNPLPPLKYDPEARRMSHCQAWEDGCEYAQCPRWRDGKIVDDAHCSLDLIGPDDD